MIHEWPNERTAANHRLAGPSDGLGEFRRDCCSPSAARAGPIKERIQRGPYLSGFGHLFKSLFFFKSKSVGKGAQANLAALVGLSDYFSKSTLPTCHFVIFTGHLDLLLTELDKV